MIDCRIVFNCYNCYAQGILGVLAFLFGLLLLIEVAKFFRSRSNLCEALGTTLVALSGFLATGGGICLAVSPLL